MWCFACTFLCWLFCLSKCLVFGVAWSNMREHFLCEHISFWRACVPFDISIQFRINSIYMGRARERMKLEKWTVLVHSMLHRRVSSRWFRLALKACWPHKRLGCREPTHDAWKRRMMLADCMTNYDNSWNASFHGDAALSHSICQVFLGKRLGAEASVKGLVEGANHQERHLCEELPSSKPLQMG